MALALVTGGTGGLGAEVAPLLVQAGYQVRVMSRRPAPDSLPPGTEWAQADIATGERLEAAVSGADVIVHCASSPQGKTRQTDIAGTERLAHLARAAGCSHLFYISIVGVDRIPFGYYQAKLAAEKVIEESGVPYSILRATQFHSLIDRFLGMLVRLPVAFVPKAFQFQPINTGEVAARMVDYVRNGPAGRLPDLGGPEVRRFGDLAGAWLKARGRRAAIANLPLPGKTADSFRKGYNCTPEHADGKITWEQWLATKYLG